MNECGSVVIAGRGVRSWFGFRCQKNLLDFDLDFVLNSTARFLSSYSMNIDILFLNLKIREAQRRRQKSLAQVH